MLIRTTVIVLLALAAPSAVDADEAAGNLMEGLTLRIEGGWSRTTNLDWPFGGGLGRSPEFGAAIGYRLHPNFRVEVAFNRRDDYDYAGQDGTFLITGKAANTAGMVNVYADLFTLDRFIPYLGVGGGRSTTTLSTADYAGGGVSGHREGRTNRNWSWQGMAGVGFRVADHVIADFGYRFFHAGAVRLRDNGDLAGVGGSFASDSRGTLQAHESMVSLRYEF